MDNDRVSNDVWECTDHDTGEFDWDEFQYLCDCADYWGCEE